MTGENDILDISETRGFKDFQVRIAETEGRRNGQEDAFFATSPNPRTSNEAPAFITEMFRQTQEKTIGMESGATASVANIGADNTLTFGHLGDSPAMLFVEDAQTGDISVHNLLKEHKLSDPEEQRMVEARGGVVVNYHGMRVAGNDGGFVAVSRAFGDNNYPGVGHEPEITQFKLQDFVKPGDRVFLCLSCDGLLEANQPQDFASILKNKIASGQTENIADAFVQHAYDSGSRDNITAMVTEIPVNRDRDLMLGIMDGHGGKEVAQMAAENIKKLSVRPTDELLAERDQSKWHADIPYSVIPDSVDLGQGFSLGKKDLPDGTSVYRIVPPADKNPHDGEKLAQSQGYMVHKIEAGNGGYRIGLTPEEFTNAWQQKLYSDESSRQPPRPISDSWSRREPSSISLGGGYELAFKEYPEGEFYRLIGPENGNPTQAIKAADKLGYYLEDKHFSDGVTRAVIPAEDFSKAWHRAQRHATLFDLENNWRDRRAAGLDVDKGNKFMDVGQSPILNGTKDVINWLQQKRQPPAPTRPRGPGL